MNIKVGIKYGSLYRVLRSTPSTVSPNTFLTIQKNYTYMRDDDNKRPIFRVHISLKSTASSGATITGNLTDDLIGIGLSDLTYTRPNIYQISTTDRQLIMNFSVAVSGTVDVYYDAQIIDVSSFTVDVANYRNVIVRSNLNGSTYAEVAYSCVYRDDVTQVNRVGQYGFIVLLVLVGILVGIVLLLLIGFLYIKVVNKDVNPFEMDDVDHPHDRMAMMETQDRLLMDEADIKNFDTIKDLSTVNNTDSIVQTLVTKNRHQLYRDLDSLDILNSIYIDQGLESDYEKISSESLILLVTNLARHGTLRVELVDKSVQKFRKNVQTLEKEVQTLHKKETNKVKKELSKKNKRQLQQLLSKHRKERETMEDDLASEDENVHKEIFELLVKQHRAERDDLVHKLKLQQDEESEKLRKRYSLQKRAMLRDLERNMLDEIIYKSNLNPSQAEWILSEHRRVQSYLDQRYNDELARQRMMLEEKLERRRALAKKKELEEENQTEMLNTLASQQVNIVKRLRREEEITPEQADEYMTKIKEDMTRAKDALDKEKDLQEKLLRERLNERKRKQMEVKNVNNQMEETQLQREMKEASVTTMVDPTAYIDALMDLHAKQREDMTQSENTIDEEDTGELIDQYQYSVAQTEANIRLTKDQLLQQLKQDGGVSEDDLSKICLKHNRELQQLQESHEEERQVQEQNLKARLLARRKEMEGNLAHEQQEQEDLQRHENTMIQNLLLNQVSISDEERDRILKEHEKNMVQVENSLTLSRLRQKRMLEEALAERKVKQMEKLQKKQAAEAVKKIQFVNDSEDEDERSHRDLIDMMKRHGEQRLELLHGDDIDIDDEVENVRSKMLEERANALKEQEERIAGMLSTLQIEKAKELSHIEEQQKAINNLKMNLMDDLNERGVLSDGKCQQIINRHQEEQSRLVQRLDYQRDEQEQLLRERLRKRMEQREQQMNSEQKRQVEESIKQLPVRQRAQAQIRRALLLHKQMVETEQFKNRLTKECNQTLEDAKRQFDVKKEKYLQDQELNFIAGLVQLGKFTKSELLAVLKILFPLKNKSEIEEVLNKIHPGQDEKLPKGSPKNDDDETDPLAESTLIDRTRVSFHGIGSIARFKLRSPKKKQTKGNLMSLNLGTDNSGLTPIDRPDPLGRDSPHVIPDVPSGRGGDLPPLESLDTKKKKKKKKKKKLQPIDDEEEGDDDTYLRVRA